MANLLTFIDECLAIAVDNGLSNSRPITITVESSVDGIKTRIVCSYTEPHDLILPYNVTWIDGDPTSPDYKSAYKRSSKSPANGLLNTWVEVLDYNTIFTPAQYYDGTDLPIVEAQEAEVQTAIAHVGENVLSGDPHKARFYIDLKINAVNNNIQESVNKSNYNYQLILDLMTAVDTLTEKVTVLEANAGVKSLVHYQESGEVTWLIPHNFGTQDVLCQIYDDNNDPILPSSMGAFDENSWIIHFDINISGKAVLVGL